MGRDRDDDRTTPRRLSSADDAHRPTGPRRRGPRPRPGVVLGAMGRRRPRRGGHPRRARVVARVVGARPPRRSPAAVDRRRPGRGLDLARRWRGRVDGPDRLPGRRSRGHRCRARDDHRRGRERARRIVVGGGRRGLPGRARRRRLRARRPAPVAVAASPRRRPRAATGPGAAGRLPHPVAARHGRPGSTGRRPPLGLPAVAPDHREVRAPGGAPRPTASRTTSSWRHPTARSRRSRWPGGTRSDGSASSSRSGPTRPTSGVGSAGPCCVHGLHRFADLGATGRAGLLGCRRTRPRRRCTRRSASSAGPSTSGSSARRRRGSIDTMTDPDRDGAPATRLERDSMGEMAVPVDARYGASTQRAVLNFPISGQRFPRRFLRALALVKLAAAETNAELGLLDPTVAHAIASAAASVADGDHDDQFPIDVYQTGSGTSTNTNMNEVVANLATARLGGSPQGPPERRRQPLPELQRHHPDGPPAGRGDGHRGSPHPRPRRAPDDPRGQGRRVLADRQDRAGRTSRTRPRSGSARSSGATPARSRRPSAGPRPRATSC